MNIFGILGDLKHFVESGPRLHGWSVIPQRRAAGARAPILAGHARQASSFFSHLAAPAEARPPTSIGLLAVRAHASSTSPSSTGDGPFVFGARHVDAPHAIRSDMS